MIKRTWIMIVVIILGGVLLVEVAAALSSPNYRLDWFTPFTSGGGGQTNSTRYVLNYTVGQTASSASTSANYQASLGYWAGVMPAGRIFLPLVLK